MTDVFNLGPITYVFVFLVGLVLGSYLNSWIWRVHRDSDIDVKRSICIHCRRQLQWYENVPLVSYLFLHGQCRTCGGVIPPDYFWVELITAILISGVSYLRITQGETLNPWQFFRDFFFITLLIIIFVYDLKYRKVLSGVVWVGVIGAWVLNYTYLNYSAPSLLIGLVVGGGFFLLQYLLSNGRWIGGGDVRLGFMMGVLLGWPVILVALFIGYILGALAAVPLLILKKKTLKSEVPFGTFLAVGTLIAMLWGNHIIEWYRQIAGW